MIKNEKGQALVEFVLIIPILLLLIVGIIDFGRILYGYTHLHLATQESVRLGGLGEGDQKIKDFAQQYVHLGDSSLLEVYITPSESERKPGDYVTVGLKYPINYITPMLSDVLPSPYWIETESTIRVE